MTTSIRIRTNGNYVCEVKDATGNILGHAGPGSATESGEIYLPHKNRFTIEERDATPAEIEAIEPLDPKQFGG